MEALSCHSMLLCPSAPQVSSLQSAPRPDSLQPASHQPKPQPQLHSQVPSYQPKPLPQVPGYQPTPWPASNQHASLLTISLPCSRLALRWWACSLPVLSQLVHYLLVLPWLVSSLCGRVLAWPFSQGPVEAAGDVVFRAPDVISNLRCPVPLRLRCPVPQRLCCPAQQRLSIQAPQSCHQSCPVQSNLFGKQQQCCLGAIIIKILPESLFFWFC